MKDFFKILLENNLYNEENHNKTDNIYHLNGNVVEFFALDDPQKVRSRRRDILWLNEGNEFTLEDWRQLSMRTNKQIFLDFNPSDQFHWIYDHVLNREDCQLIVSTYLDNPFLPIELVKEIEGYKLLDENYWKIYGLGERGTSNATVYTHWQLIDKLPEDYDEEIYGLDFGFNNPSCLQKIRIKDQNVHSQELIYQSKLTNAELIMRLKGWSRMTEDEKEKWISNGRTEEQCGDLKVPYSALIYCDAAEPQRIEEIRQAGFNAIAANKDVKKGIDTLKTRHWFITKDSINTQKESKAYRYKVINGEVTDEPVKANDHAMDAIRYPVHTHSNQPFIGFV